MKPKGTGLIQSNKMDKHVMTKQSAVMAGVESEEPRSSEPSLATILVAIQDLKTSLEPNVDVVTIDVNLMRTNLQKMSEKVTLAASHINLLQSTSKNLEEEVQCLTHQQELRAKRLEDEDGNPLARGHYIRKCHNPFFPDFTLQGQQKCRSFDEVKKMPCSKDIKYMMLFPDRLRILVEGNTEAARGASLPIGSPPWPREGGAVKGVAPPYWRKAIRRSRRVKGQKRDGATTGKEKPKTPGILGRRAGRRRSRHLYSPDPEARTAGPGEHMSEPATLQEKRGQARYGVLTQGKGAGGGRTKGKHGHEHKQHGRVGKQGRKREETKGQDAGRSYEPKIGARREKERETDHGEEKRKIIKKQTNSRQ
ncbi:hypothetical protein NDU88_004615 [Pleurodeles waltl]|uniref:Uncharacterized protein n=1 Tax=Pleurodeles waltl TaxID=8319 RepID=A0AAV7UJR3_PLEWA|nr:hypothetical protein NDU88_004615 [Pleurodeles waltl]